MPNHDINTRIFERHKKLIQSHKSLWLLWFQHKICLTHNGSTRQVLKKIFPFCWERSGFSHITGELIYIASYLDWPLTMHSILIYVHTTVWSVIILIRLRFFVPRRRCFQGNPLIIELLVTPAKYPRNYIPFSQTKELGCSVIATKELARSPL